MSDAVPADWLARTFGLGRPLAVSQKPARGTMGEVWRLETDAGAWAVKRQFPWARADRFEIEATAVDAAVAAGLSTARIVRAAGGAVEAVHDERRWRVFSWLDLGPPLPLPLRERPAAQLGALLARLHRSPASGFESEVMPWFTARRPAEQWTRLEAGVRRDGLAIAPAFEQALPDILDLASIAPPVPVGRCVVSHCDLTNGNVLPLGDGLAVIDWEHAGSIPPLWELGYVLQHWVLGPDGVNAAAARAIVGAYRDGVGERSALSLDIFAGAVSAWLNWTIGRIYGAWRSTNETERAESLATAANLLAAPLTRSGLQAIISAVEA
jgi:aminoglycoside phosphotransferase (APT) family kinase protein